MNKIHINREYVASHLLRYIDSLLCLPEIKGVKLCDIVIQNNADKEANVNKALNRSYHDCYSDSDIKLLVHLPTNSKITPAEYMKHPARFGVNPDQYLGFLVTGDSGIYRIIFQDGTRYDLGFEFRYDDSFPDIEMEKEPERYSNPQWPIEKVDAFWFVMIQALGKLYRRDYLISSHLANVCVNDTLVQQMILRDLEQGTTHHRYGYSEKLTYRKYEGQNKFVTGDDTFDIIADKLYAAALAYDELTKEFYSAYEARSTILFDIWRCYDEYRIRQ